MSKQREVDDWEDVTTDEVDDWEDVSVEPQPASDTTPIPEFTQSENGEMVQVKEPYQFQKDSPFIAQDPQQLLNATTPAAPSEYLIDDQPLSREEFKSRLHDDDLVEKMQSGNVKLTFPQDDEMQALIERQSQAGSRTDDKWDYLMNGLYTVGAGVAGLQSYVQNIMREGLGAVGVDLPKGIHEMMSEQAADGMLKKAQEQIEKTRVYEEGFLQSISNGDYLNASDQAFNMIAQSAPITVMAAVTGGVGGTGAALGTLGAVSSSSEYAGSDAEEYDGLTNAEKLMRATAIGSFEAIGEVVSGGILSKNFKLLKTGLKNTVKKAAEVGGTEAAQVVATELGKKMPIEMFKEYGLDIFKEGGSELVTELGQMGTDDLMGLKDYSAADYLHNGLEAMSLGAVGGSTMGLPTAGLGIKRYADEKLKKGDGEKLKAKVDERVKNETYTPEEGEKIKVAVDNRVEAVNSVPDEMVSNTEVIDLVNKKQDLEKETIDPVLAPIQNAKIKAIDSQIQEKVAPILEAQAEMDEIMKEVEAEKKKKGEEKAMKRKLKLYDKLLADENIDPVEKRIVKEKKKLVEEKIEKQAEKKEDDKNKKEEGEKKDAMPEEAAEPLNEPVNKEAEPDHLSELDRQLKEMDEAEPVPAEQPKIPIDEKPKEAEVPEAKKDEKIPVKEVKKGDRVYIDVGDKRIQGIVSKARKENADVTIDGIEYPAQTELYKSATQEVRGKGEPEVKIEKPSIAEIKSKVITKAPKAKKAAKEEGVSLKTQKEDLLAQIDKAQKIVEAVPNNELALQKEGFKTTTNEKGVMQVVFEVEGDGTFHLAANGLKEAHEQVKKHWSVKEQTEPVGYTGGFQGDGKTIPRNRMPSQKAIGDYDTPESAQRSKQNALDNLAAAKESGNKALVDLYQKQAELESKEYIPAKQRFNAKEEVDIAVESTISFLKDNKIISNDPTIQKSGFVDLEKAIRFVGEAIKKGIDIHGDVKRAIEEAIDSLKKRDFFKRLSPESQKEVEGSIRAEHEPKGEPLPEDGEGKKALAGRVAEGEVPKEISDAVEKHGLNYSIESHPEAERKASDFIAEVGVEKALKAARKGQIDGGAETFVWTAAIDAVHKEYLTETNAAKKEKLLEKETDLIDEFDKKMRSQGRSISALQAAYQVADLGYKLGAIMNRAKEAAGEGGVPEILKNKLADISARLDEVSKKLAESEKKVKESPPPKIISEPKVKANRPSLSPEELTRKQELSKKYRGVFNDVTRVITTVAEKDFREYAGLVLKEAAGDFRTFAREMINTVGKEIREHLPKLYKELGGKENPEMQAIQRKLKNEIDEFERRKREKDFSQKEPKEKPDLDEETFNLLVEKNRLKEEVDTEIEKLKLKNRPISKKIEDSFVDAVSLPKSLMASADMSAPLRQGAVLSFRHPVMAARAMREMFKQAFSEKAQQQWLTRLKSTPEYYAIKKAELYLAEPNARLNAKEEQFISTIAHRIPIWGQVVKGSERAYTGYLNKLRVDVFTAFHDALLREGVKGKELDAELKSYASFVNNASGRGTLGKFEESAPLLNAAFFSPRYVVSRFNLLNPLTYAKMTPKARIEAMKTMGAYLGVGLMTMILAKAGGAEVEDDPRSADFGKIKVGNTRFDIWAGMTQVAVLLSRLAKGETKAISGEVKTLGEGYKPTTRGDVLLRFGRSKLSPSAGIAADVLVGKDFNGNDITVTNEVLKTVLPLWVSDIRKIYIEAGAGTAAAAGAASFFGVGVQNYKPGERKNESSPTKPKVIPAAF